MAIISTSLGNFSVKAPPVYLLTITSQPTLIKDPSIPFSISAEVRDGSGTLTTKANGPATIRVVSGPSGTILSGTTTKNIVNGVVTFDDLTVNRVGDIVFEVAAYEYGLGLLEETGIDKTGAFRFFDFTSGNIDEARVCKASGISYDVVGSPEERKNGIYFSSTAGLYFQDAPAYNLNASANEELTVIAWGDFDSYSSGWSQIFGASTSSHNFWSLGITPTLIGLNWSQTVQQGGGYSLTSPPTFGEHLIGATIRLNGSTRYGFAFHDGENIFPSGTNAANTPSLVIRYSDSYVFIWGGIANYKPVAGALLRQVALFTHSFSDEEMLEQARRCGLAMPLTSLSAPVLVASGRVNRITPLPPRLPRGPKQLRTPLIMASSTPSNPPMVVFASLTDKTLEVLFGDDIDHTKTLSTASFIVKGGVGENVEVLSANYNTSNSVVLELAEEPSPGTATVTVAADAVFSSLSNLGNIETVVDFYIETPYVPPPPPTEEPLVAILSDSKLKIIFSRELDTSYPLNISKFTLNDGILKSPQYTGKHEISFDFEEFPINSVAIVVISEGAIVSKDGITNEEAVLTFNLRDVIPPAITDINPPPGAPITSSTKIDFLINDESGLNNILIAVQYDALGKVDVAHDGVNFCNGYTGTREVVGAGFRYTLMKTDKWPAAPKIRVFAVDKSGNQLN